MKTQASHRERRQPQISKRRGVAGGAPAIAGTRIRVADVAWQARLAGEQSADAVAYVITAYPHVTRKQVEAALQYYSDHRAEIDLYMAEEEALAAEWSQNKAST